MRFGLPFSNAPEFDTVDLNDPASGHVMVVGYDELRVVLGASASRLSLPDVGSFACIHVFNPRVAQEIFAKQIGKSIPISTPTHLKLPCRIRTSPQAEDFHSRTGCPPLIRVFPQPYWTVGFKVGSPMENVNQGTF